MRKKIKSFFLIFLITLSGGQSVYAVNKFDADFFNLNNIVYYDADTEECVSSSGTTLTGSDNIEKVWNFLKYKGLTDEQVAGIMGSLWGESHFNPGAEEIGNSIGYGIAQWSFGRRTNLENYAKQQGKPVSDLGVQLDFLWTELEGPENDALIRVKASSSVREATIAWTLGFERPREDVIADRIAEGEELGNQFLAKFKGKGGESSSNSNSNSSGKITFIGDSITVGVKSQLEANFSGSNVKAEIGQGVDWAINQLTSDIKESVIVNLGTNDKFTNGKNLLNKLKDKKKVYLVNIYGTGGNADFETTNKNISDSIKDFSNAQLLDWKAYVDQNGGRSKFYAQEAGGANYHLNNEGNDLYVKFLKEKVSGSSSSSDSCKTNFAGSSEASLTTKDGFSIFYQTDKRWADKVYYKPSNFTIGEAGCGPTAMTMILVALGVSVTPVEVAEKASELGQVVAGAGAAGTQASVLAKHYGLKSEIINNKSIEDINRHLDQGHLIWMGGATLEPPFTAGGHMIVVRKKTDKGNWLIANPYNYPYSNNIDNDPMKEFNPSTIVSASNMATAVWK